MSSPAPIDYGIYDRAIERAEYATQALRDAASGAFSPGYGVIFDCEHDLVTTNGCKLIAGPGSPWSEP